jgi:hypothetical protein
LIIGYIKINHQQERRQVLKLIATMLNFTPQELEQAESVGETKWFGLLKTSPTGSKVASKQASGQNIDQLNKSFAELLIQYVDRESKPKPSLSFDVNNPNISQTNKKTDVSLLSPSSGNNSPHSTANSASAIKFFNSSLVSNTPADLTLVNRNLIVNPNNTSIINSATDSSTTASTSTPNVFTNIASPAVANSFLEQILK